MEINTQQLEALLQLQEQQAHLQKRNNAPAQGFEALLNEQLMGAQETTHGSQAITGSQQADFISRIPMVDTEKNGGISAEDAVLQAAFDQTAVTLDLWDQYAKTLGQSTSEDALRNAYSMLEGIDAQISQMRANYGTGANRALDGLINELEVLATTEKFKFNRGDYLI